jgi:hypothetical protein
MGPSIRKTACLEYEELFLECRCALKSWRKRRNEIASLGLSDGKAAELQRLRKDYTYAYSRLEKHPANCDLCGFVSKIGGRDYTGVLDAVLDKRRQARVSQRVDVLTRRAKNFAQFTAFAVERNPTENPLEKRHILLDHVETLGGEVDRLLSLTLTLPEEARWEFEKVHAGISNVLSAMREDLNLTPMRSNSYSVS